MECAVAIHAWTEFYRALPSPAKIGLGRTRIGIETGQAIVGDVGMQSKLDYTAHGDAVNAAARFEAANKELGSAICVGPAAAARCDAGMLRPLGTISVRGRDEPAAVFEPWPIDTPSGWRERYMVAFGLMDRDPTRAASLFEQLAAECKNDQVVRVMAERSRAAGVSFAPEPGNRSVALNRNHFIRCTVSAPVTDNPAGVHAVEKRICSSERDRRIARRPSVMRAIEDGRYGALEIGRPIQPPMLLWPKPLDLRLERGFDRPVRRLNGDHARPGIGDTASLADALDLRTLLREFASAQD